MNLNSVKATIRTPTVIGLMTLVMGIALGVAGEKYAGRSVSAIRSTQVTDASIPSAGKTAPRLPADPLDNNDFDSWDPFREMRSLQAEMDEMFRRSVARFRTNPQMNAFKDDAGYSLSLDVRDLRDHYEVRAYLPDDKAPNAKVRLEGNRLEVEVTHQQTETQQSTNAPAVATEWGRYTQVVELAGHLKVGQMKVEHKEHELLITVPKA